MAARFWVGGTGTWDASATTHWATASGITAGASVPGAADTVTFDGSSGGGTVTVNTTVTVTSLTMGAFTGTLDFDPNDNNVTISSTNTGLTLTGTATRTLNMGGGTWTFTGANGGLDATTQTNLTFTASGTTIVYAGSGQTATRSLIISGATIGTFTVSANNGLICNIPFANTFGTVNIDDKNNVQFPTAGTTITTLNITGSTSTPVLIETGGQTAAPITVTTANITGAAIRAIAFTGSPTAANSYDIGSNTGITITPPASGGGSKMIG